MAELHYYTVGVRNHETTMKLSEDGAKAMEADGYTLSRTGSAQTMRPQDVTAPAGSLDEDGKPLPTTDDGNRPVRSRQRERNTERRAESGVETASRQPEDK